MDYCEDCGGTFDRPGLFGCVDARHADPTLAQRIVAAIERDLNGRRGLGLTVVDDAMKRRIRDRWAELIEEELSR